MAAGIFADCNLGLTLRQADHHQARPATWVVIVTSGYNNLNGVGRRRRRLPLRSGRPHRRAELQDRDRRRRRHATPSGLAQINNYVDNVDIDNTTLRAYGGDVLGNIWRFDSAWRGPRRCSGTAKDAANNIAADHDQARARRARRQAVRHGRHRQAAGRHRRHRHRRSNRSTASRIRSRAPGRSTRTCAARCGPWR